MFCVRKPVKFTITSSLSVDSWCMFWCVCACFHEYRGATKYTSFQTFLRVRSVLLLFHHDKKIWSDCPFKAAGEKQGLYQDTERRHWWFLHLLILTSSMCSRTAYRADSDHAEVSLSNTMNHYKGHMCCSITNLVLCLQGKGKHPLRDQNNILFLSSACVVMGIRGIS